MGQIEYSIKLINGLLWIILGLLILIWLITGSTLIEQIIWIGFVFGCILVGILQLLDLLIKS